MSKGTVKIKETLAGDLVKFEVRWPSGKVFTKYVDQSDDVNERTRQVRFATERGYDAEFDMTGKVWGE